ncbi:Fic family protein [Pelomyxa schiedti]|nr:Fic family protein [Pelomyxa schiedti]
MKLNAMKAAASSALSQNNEMVSLDWEELSEVFESPTASGGGSRLWDAGSAARDIVSRLVTDNKLSQVVSSLEDDDAPAEQLQNEVTEEFVKHYGEWARGWCWTKGEGGGAGVVTAWCCYSHSFTGKNPREAIVSALVEWREWVKKLGTIFDKMRTDLAPYNSQQATARAASHLLPLVLRWTGADDAWYSTFAQILAWYLSSFIPESEAMELMLKEMSGKFESWCAPNAKTSTSVCESIGKVLGDKIEQLKEEESEEESSVTESTVRHATTVDSLAAWLAIRNSFAWAPPNKLFLPSRRDGQTEYITTHDTKRDPARATNMLAALAQERDASARGLSLSFELIGTWQQTLLGSPSVPKFRTTDAFAKSGEERYPFTSSTVTEFQSALQQSESDIARGAVVCAARAYLDVCFFHPFEDGNSRCARLVLDFILRKNGLTVDNMEPLIVPWYASDPNVPLSFLQALVSVCFKL